MTFSSYWPTKSAGCNQPCSPFPSQPPAMHEAANGCQRLDRLSGFKRLTPGNALLVQTSTAWSTSRSLREGGMGQEYNAHRREPQPSLQVVCCGQWETVAKAPLGWRTAWGVIHSFCLITCVGFAFQLRNKQTNVVW